MDRAGRARAGLAVSAPKERHDRGVVRAGDYGGGLLRDNFSGIPSEVG
jgi:hypothetical protein